MEHEVEVALYDQFHENFSNDFEWSRTRTTPAGTLFIQMLYFCFARLQPVSHCSLTYIRAAFAWLYIISSLTSATFSLCILIMLITQCVTWHLH